MKFTYPLLCILLPAVGLSQVPSAASPVATPAPAVATTAPPVGTVAPAEEMQEVGVSAPEPRYVAPTLRDRIGRIWAPVLLDGQGPFRLVLDTGANRSGIIPRVAVALGDKVAKGRPVRLLGVTGSTVVETLRVKKLEVGELILAPATLPIIPDVFGGADGVLGTEGLANKRIVVDFKHDSITIKRSRREKAPPGFVTLPISMQRDNLLVVDIRIGRIKAKAVIDTGAPSSLGNTALLDALVRYTKDGTDSEIQGVTLDIEHGSRSHIPTIYMDRVSIAGAMITFSDVYIFRHYGLTREPTIMLGMDLLGVVDELIIDYRTRELHLKTHRGTN